MRTPDEVAAMLHLVALGWGVVAWRRSPRASAAYVG